MKPNRHNQVLSDDRRLNGGKKTSRWAAKTSDGGRDEARRAAELEKARDRLAEALDQYIKFLTDKTLPKNRSLKDREKQAQLLNGLPKLASELNKRNVEEGSMVVASTSLNSILVLRDEINKLRYENYFLNKDIKALISRVEALEAQQSKENEDDGSDAAE